MNDDLARAGDVSLESGDDYWTACIDIGEHYAKVQCYGKTQAEAEALRDRILAALRATPEGATPAEDGACSSCGGLNTSCPEGCERDPRTGELIAPTPQAGDDAELIEALRGIAEFDRALPSDLANSHIADTCARAADRLASLTEQQEGVTP